MESRLSWRPARADELLRHLSRRLLDAAVGDDPTLAQGACGAAIAHAAFADAFPDDGHLERAAAALDRAVAAAAAQPLPLSLHHGVVGIAWTDELLRGDPDAADDAELDVALEAQLAVSWDGHFELMRGLVGIGVYALDRLPRASARRLLALLVDRLHDASETSELGRTWPTRPEWFPPELRAIETPYYNLGLAHGVPGVISLLAAIHAADAALAPRVRPMLDGAVSWLLAQRFAPGQVGAFPSLVGAGERGPARLGWCYGDLGAALALRAAARATGTSAWHAVAMDLALGAAARDPSTSRVADAAMCHGAAGVAHLFHRLYLGEGDERLAVAARFWLDRALDLATDGDDAGLIGGSSGIALALLTATGACEPAWDRALLVAVP
jgi:hypothetical protein